MISRPVLWGCLGLLVAFAGCVSSGNVAKIGGKKVSPTLAARFNTEMAYRYMQAGDMDLARRKLALARREVPNDPIVHNALAFYYTQIGKYARAEREFHNALALAPNNPDTLNNYGTFLCRQGKYRASLKYFTRAATNLNYATPDSALANAGTCALKIPDKKIARRYFEQALAINPNQPRALWQLGLMAFEKGNYSSANDRLGRLVSSDRNASPRVLWTAIEAAWAVGDQVNAKRYGRRLLKRFPGSREARKFIRLISRTGQ